MLAAARTVLAATLLLAAAPSAANAGAGIQCPRGWVANTGYAACTLIASGGGTGGGGPGGGHGGSGGEPVCMYQGHPIPCTTDEGYWYAPLECWINEAENVPEDDPAWQGNYPDGAVYQCWRPAGFPTLRWFPNPPPPTEGAVPMDLLGTALARMGLRGIEMGSTPPMLPDRVGVIGFPTWLWAQDPSPQTWGPNTASVSAGGYSMTATAKANRVQWEMGNGDVVNCDNPGTAWNARLGDADSPTCGYRYLDDGDYAVQAVTFWEVQWSGLGQTGTIPLALFSRGQITMAEVQVLVQRGS